MFSSNKFEPPSKPPETIPNKKTKIDTIVIQMNKTVCLQQEIVKG